MWSAKWIWNRQETYNPYNQTVIFRKDFQVATVSGAFMRITADSFYRLYINGAWVNDGPARSWPEHYSYDEFDVSAYLEKGRNSIEVVVRYFGTGTFHTRPQQAGFLAQLDLVSATGKQTTLGTDATWEAADALAYLANTPKVSIQMEPQEVYDARLEDDLDFQPAAVLYPYDGGPWKDLQPRASALLSREPTAPRAFVAANLLEPRTEEHYSFHTARLAHPGVIEANQTVSQAGGLATLLTLSRSAEFSVAVSGLEVWIDGQLARDGRFALKRGKHLLVAFVTEVTGHNKVKDLRFEGIRQGLNLSNPVDESQANPWVWLAFPEYTFNALDIHWPFLGLLPEHQQLVDAYLAEAARLGRAAVDLDTFGAEMGQRVVCLDTQDMLLEDHWWRFNKRAVIDSAAGLVQNPEALMYNHPAVTTVLPSPEGDVELVYDLGQQNIGYYEFELVADAGVVLDIYGIEYITPQGVLQHTQGNRNGMRYITRKGNNLFTSIKRRSGRYLFITLRNQSSPVLIRRLQLIESTYPVNTAASFQCSDARLEKIWEISARTLKLCMEDTFTDCPLYEQTHWVGDARNESLYAYPVFGAVDLGKNCIRLTAQSLERYPLAGCQVPSGWDCVLPAWAFLWGISVWDYYEYTGDPGFVREMWPWVLLNLKNAAGMREPSGLLSAPFWHLFDWSGNDDNRLTVLHDSMLLVGAVDAARKLADVLADAEQAAWLAGFHAELVDSLRRYWDPQLKAFPDSLLPDGSRSPVVSQHTSFLSLLYDIIPPEFAPDALQNMLAPAENMVRVGSPFAMQYFYEALEKMGREDVILQSIYAAYLPMLADGATTVWETFPSSAYRPGDFPTRSHCHAWSAAPLHFLNRIILGVRPTGVGGAAFEVSPRLYGVTWAEGVQATAAGPLRTAWKLVGTRLEVTVRAPRGTQVVFKDNPTLAGLQVDFKVAAG
jgi:hypothetical protein